VLELVEGYTSATLNLSRPLDFAVYGEDFHIG